jgi:hypothetical protein
VNILSGPWKTKIGGEIITITSLIPAVAGILFLLFGFTVSVKENIQTKKLWILPASLSLLFLALSVFAVVNEGPFGFWVEHTRNLWGNQIWVDLLFAVGIGWFLMVPKAKALGMRPVPWLILIVCTGCIGFMAMMARLLYLKEKV